MLFRTWKSGQVLYGLVQIHSQGLKLSPFTRIWSICVISHVCGWNHDPPFPHHLSRKERRKISRVDLLFCLYIVTNSPATAMLSCWIFVIRCAVEMSDGGYENRIGLFLSPTCFVFKCHLSIYPLNPIFFWSTMNFNCMNREKQKQNYFWNAEAETLSFECSLMAAGCLIGSGRGYAAGSVLITSTPVLILLTLEGWQAESTPPLVLIQWSTGLKLKTLGSQVSHPNR